jgi:hypothetical protein
MAPRTGWRHFRREGRRLGFGLRWRRALRAWCTCHGNRFACHLFGLGDEAFDPHFGFVRDDRADVPSGGQLSGRLAKLVPEGSKRNID